MVQGEYRVAPQCTATSNTPLYYLKKKPIASMAKSVTFSPQFLNLKNQILFRRRIRAGESSIWHRPIFYDRPRKLIDKTSINTNRKVENVIHTGRLASISVTPLPCVPASAHPLRSRRNCFGLPCVSILPLRRSRPPHLQLFLMMSSHSQSNTHDVPNNPPQDSTKTVKCAIKGRVQGVFYRNWTVENAKLLGLKGWVRNRRDGSVEALFSGKPEAVDEMLQRCRRGPPDAMVTAFEAVPCNEDPGEGFQRKQTV